MFHFHLSYSLFLSYIVLFGILIYFYISSYFPFFSSFYAPLYHIYLPIPYSFPLLIFPYLFSLLSPIRLVIPRKTFPFPFLWNLFPFSFFPNSILIRKTSLTCQMYVLDLHSLFPKNTCDFYWWCLKWCVTISTMKV